MTPGAEVELVQRCRPEEVEPALRDGLIACWTEVSDAGGAAGFPFPPVRADEVAAAVDTLVAGLDPRRSRLLLALDAGPDGRASGLDGGGVPAGWVHLGRDLDPLIAHWGVVRHLQTRLGRRNRGIGSALMRALTGIARDELELRQLRLALRGGTGLEDFYARLGWREAGRWPEALRLAPGDLRDEVLMELSPL